MTIRRILVVDDEEPQAANLCRYIQEYISSAPGLFSEPIEVEYATDAVRIANELRVSRGVGFRYHLIIADVFMPPGPGEAAGPLHGGVLLYETIRGLKAAPETQDLDVKLILISNRDDADRVLAKPRREQHALGISRWMFTLAKTTRAPGPSSGDLMKHDPWVREIGRAISSLFEDDWMAWRLSGKVGELLSVSASLDEVKRAIDDWKEVYLVTVEGERGVGVDLVARALHDASSRRAQPFLAPRCNVEGQFLEQRLFGGGGSDLGELAGGAAGTVFLDGFGEQPLANPSAFRDLFDPALCEYRSVGGGDTKKFGGAFVIGTLDANRLCDLVAGGGSFADFIQPHVIRIPPLRDRRRDTRFLAEHYWEEAQTAQGRRLEPLSEAVLDVLTEHPWPGNLIELRQVISSTVREASSPAVSVDLLPAYIRGASGRAKSSPNRLESALRVTQGNRAKADILLGATSIDDEFTQGFLEDPYLYCPMLAYYGKKAAGLWPGQPAPLRGKRLLVLLHYLRDLVPFVQSLRALGLGDGMGHFFYKSYPYPQRSAIDLWLQDQSFQSLPVDKINLVLEAIAGDTAEPILVLEDGGHLLSAILGGYPRLLERVVGAVEQTRRGEWNIAEALKTLPARPSFDILSVAGSDLKNTFEPPHVARSVVKNIERLLPDFALTGKNVGVIGNGAIGKAVCQELAHTKCRIHVFDLNQNKRLEAAQAGFMVSESAANLVKAARLVIGTSGQRAIRRAEFLEMQHGTVLVSSSSEQYEFDLDELGALSSGRSQFPVYGSRAGTSFSLRGGLIAKQVILLADGYPINFWGMESMPNQVSDLVLSLLLLAIGAVGAGKAATETGVIDSAIVNKIADSFEVARIYNEYYP